jgi:cephalosporin-C deacetylase-like acetyl esterase
MKKLLALVILVALAAWVYYFIYNEQPFILNNLLKRIPDFEELMQKTPKEGHDITFVTPDNVVIKGTWYSSTNNFHAPIIILIHQYQTSRHDFDAFIPTLLTQGYSVLAYDTRNTSELLDLPKDVPGAIAFVKKQNGVDPMRIGIIGASVGANIAFVAAGAVSEVKAVVLLSPGVSGVRGQVQNGSNHPPKNVFVASDENEWAEANMIFEKAMDPKTQKIYQGMGHGVQLLRSDTARGDIMTFLKQKI